MLKRITATVSASMDSVVSRVEDHDAVIESSIKECRQAAARTRVRLARVKRDGEQLHNTKSRLENDIARWENRAIDAAGENENRAIQCLKRKKTAESQLAQTTNALALHLQTEQKLAKNLAAIESRISGISQKRNTMRSRQSLSEAMRIIHKLEGDSCHAIDDTFDRWESNLLEQEIAIETDYSADPFENEYIEQEEMDSLKGELEELTKQKPDRDHE
jgi:phage shock protein A